MDNNTKPDPDFPFTINYDQIIVEKNMLAITKLLAYSIKANPYMSPASFIKDMGSTDLELIQEVGDSGADDPHFNELILMTEMLAQAEGIPSMSMEEMNTRVNQFLIFITMESLKRKGLIRIFYENMSFGDDYLDKMIAEKL
jgi:hypothetical protein